MEWQPIETAPRDVRVLIRFRCGHVEDATIHPCSDDGGWIYCLFDGEQLMDTHPTHWMPLPNPPKA